MKIDRLIGILSVLLQKEKVTAPELAEKFEVSRRTINRDIEDLCRAGIPISTSQGVGGGISIMEGYNWKTYGDMNMIFFKRCQSISEEEALEKFKESHKKVMEVLETFSQEELFTNSFYSWVGGSCIGSYFIGVTSSHYDWAMKKIKAHKKNCK